MSKFHDPEAAVKTRQLEIRLELVKQQRDTWKAEYEKHRDSRYEANRERDEARGIIKNLIALIDHPARHVEQAYSWEKEAREALEANNE